MNIQSAGLAHVGAMFALVTPGNGRIAKSSDVQSRLDRLESLLEKAVSGQPGKPAVPARAVGDSDTRDHEVAFTPSSNSQTSLSAGIADDGDGTLLLDGGQSKFVSSLHYALLAEEIQDIKALLGDRSDEEQKEVPQNSLVDLLSLGRAGAGSNLERLLPRTQEQRDTLLDVYFANVDPMVRITHRQTLLRNYTSYMRETHPLAFAICFSAVNSLPPNVVQSRFGEAKEELLERFQFGVEISLARENYLTTSSLEIFQGFVLWLTCITKEEDMGKAWALLGIATRIALHQGLHRDPSLFPTGSMDALTIELRRRIWHQLGHLEFRAAECKGQEPSMSEDYYTTLFPRNVEDDELVNGASPGPAPYDEERFTSMTFQLVRYQGMAALRRIIRNPARELQDLYEQIKKMLDEVHAECHRKYLRYCNPEIPMQRLCMGLASLLEWRCYLLFWLRMPRAYRDVVFSDDIRKSIFEKSVNCIETINGASVDVDAARFQWHIGGAASFQAIMHVLSELRNPMFDSPDRQRALRALQMSRILRENNGARAWLAVKAMIDKAIQEHSMSQRAQSQTSSAFASPSAPVAPTIQNDGNVRVYPGQGHVPSYVSQPSTNPYTQSATTSQPVHAQHQTAYVQSMGPMQEQVPPSWEDINLSNINNIVDSQPTPGIVPEFDFGFWGDPFNYESEPAAFPADGTYFPPWNG
ncbi:hypothetical protein E8E13_002670 [Curvularia kusanoi]|uniref:Xylanolytic transcriptional activator regulatory domain-containing protein n=1 Tax=Curvularia kusanoi TaxID=90978 RepID=A0A9P4T9C9_CURKU|nr:hypothetical protein E8E13_002670 [Curvularia kusanoi]